MGDKFGIEAVTMEPERKKLFGERLKQACISHYGKEHGIVTYLATDMGVSNQTASKWLQGKVMPEPVRWPKLSGILQVSAQWLVGSTHEEPESLRGKIDDKALDLAGKASEIVFPLVMRLRPDAGKELVSELVKHAYQELKAGRDESAVSGEVASRLI